MQTIDDRNGFTLIEALITTVVLVTGLAAVAGVFAYSSLESLRIRQQTAATALVSSKMEELKAAEDPPIGHFSENLEISVDGRIVAGGLGAAYMRTWEVTAEEPGRITVVIYSKRAGRRGYLETARATTTLGRRF